MMLVREGIYNRDTCMLEGNLIYMEGYGQQEKNKEGDIIPRGHRIPPAKDNGRSYHLH